MRTLPQLALIPKTADLNNRDFLVCNVYKKNYYLEFLFNFPSSNCLSVFHLLCAMFHVSIYVYVYYSHVHQVTSVSWMNKRK